jgi:3-oxoadipate enol-lactonase
VYESAWPGNTLKIGEKRGGFAMMKQVSLPNGVRLAYTDAGSGAPLMLVHGFCGSSAYWQKVIPALAKRFRVIVPDLRGHGSSSAPDEPYTMERLAEDLVHLLDALEVEQTTLLGHSLGGYVTLAFAERYADRLTGFGLIHSTAYPDDEQGKANRDKSMESIRQNGMEPFIKALVPRLFAPDSVTSRPDDVRLAREIGLGTDPQGAIRTLQGMRDRPDRRHVLQKTSLPVLLVAGEQDQIVSPAKTFTADGSHVRQVLLPKAGHMGMLEVPDDLTAAIGEFMGSF